MSERTCDALGVALEEIERLKRESYCPGLWHCRTCGFIQVKNILAPNGVFANEEIHAEPCPNEGDVMFPMTWKEAEMKSREAIELWSGRYLRAMEIAEELAVAIQPCMDLAGMTTAGMIRSCGKCDHCGGMTPSGGIHICRKCGSEYAFAALKALEDFKPKPTECKVENLIVESKEED